MTSEMPAGRNVGYIGLGAMGGQLARRLLRAGPLQVWELDAALVAALERDGAGVAPDAAELARRCDIVFLSLPRTRDVEQVVFGPRGLIGGLRPGTLLVDQTSGTPAETRAIAERLAQAGVSMVDAPVSGTPAAAAAGQVTVLHSGAPADLQRVSHWLQAISPKVLHCGAQVGDAQAVKLINNTVNTGCRLATLELAALGRRCGLDLATITEALNHGAGCNRPSQLMLTALVEGRASTDFALKHVLKDINQCLAIGMAQGTPMPIAGVVRGMLQIGCHTLGDAARLEDVVPLLESMNAVRLAGPAGIESPVDADERARLAAWIDAAVAACNAWITEEGLALGARLGLGAAELVAALRASSGWSRYLDQIIERPAGAPERLGAAASQAAGALRDVASLAIERGASALIAFQVLSQVEVAAGR